MHITQAAESRAPAYAQAMAARNLQLLQAIESTLDGLSSDTALIETIAKGFAELQERLEKVNPSAAVDPAGQVCSALEGASDCCVRMFHRATGKHRAACEDPRLTEDDGVAEAYEGHIDALKRLHDSIEHLRDYVATHDALLDAPSGGSYTSADALFEAMGIKAR